MTDFSRRVYRVVSGIPRGHVLSYAEVAHRAGSPGAARRVGTLMARNPYPKKQVPCHRVVRSGGYLGNYSGRGGAATKEKLLLAEGVLVIRGKIARA